MHSTPQRAWCGGPRHSACAAPVRGGQGAAPSAEGGGAHSEPRAQNPRVRFRSGAPEGRRDPHCAGKLASPARQEGGCPPPPNPNSLHPQASDPLSPASAPSPLNADGNRCNEPNPVPLLHYVLYNPTIRRKPCCVRWITVSMYYTAPFVYVRKSAPDSYPPCPPGGGEDTPARAWNPPRLRGARPPPRGLRAGAPGGVPAPKRPAGGGAAALREGAPLKP
eukprot:1195261-Prorocentrum_minimum.AAC.4